MEISSVTATNLVKYKIIEETILEYCTLVCVVGPKRCFRLGNRQAN